MQLMNLYQMNFMISSPSLKIFKLKGQTPKVINNKFQEETASIIIGVKPFYLNQY